jgi:hypothetical protein
VGILPEEFWPKTLAGLNQRGFCVKLTVAGGGGLTTGKDRGVLMPCRS